MTAPWSVCYSLLPCPSAMKPLQAYPAQGNSSNSSNSSSSSSSLPSQMESYQTPAQAPRIPLLLAVDDLPAHQPLGPCPFVFLVALLEQHIQQVRQIHRQVWKQFATCWVTRATQKALMGCIGKLLCCIASGFK